MRIVLGPLDAAEVRDETMCLLENRITPEAHFFSFRASRMGRDGVLDNHHDG
jgi:hypothetical protein